jgi:hypothetical protein
MNIREIGGDQGYTARQSCETVKCGRFQVQLDLAKLHEQNCLELPDML